MKNRILLSILITILIFTNTYKANANPIVVPAVVGGAAIIGGVGAATASVLEGVKGFENADTAWEITKTTYNVGEAAYKEAINAAGVAAIEAGVKTVNLTSELVDSIKSKIISEREPSISFSSEEIATFGLTLSSNILYAPSGSSFVISGNGVNRSLSSLSMVDYPGGPYFRLTGTMFTSVNITNNYTAYKAAWVDAVTNKNLGSFYSLVLSAASSAGYVITLDNKNMPIDNWADEVDRILTNVLTPTTPIDLSEVIATNTATGETVLWDYPQSKWRTKDGTLLTPDLPVENVRPYNPTYDTDVDVPIVPDVPANPSFELDLSVPETAALNFTPLTNVFGDVTTKFPFSIPWDLKKQLSVFNVSPEAPKIDIDFSNFPYADPGTKWTLDLSFMNPLAAAARWALTIAIDIAFILMLRRLLPE